MLAFYKKQLHLEDAHFSRIEHEDTIVALVYKVVLPDGTEFILKICDRVEDFKRETHFLKHFKDIIPVPQIIQTVGSAILMQCLPGKVLKKKDMSEPLAQQIGSCLALIHQERVQGYGDLIYPEKLSPDPRVPFTLKFEEGVAECQGHLPEDLLTQCQNYFHSHLDLLKTADGPCIIHRDFRLGNMIAQNGELHGIIDWSSARASFAEEDFCYVELEEWIPHAREAFLAAYASVRKIPSYEPLMPLLKINRAIAALGFIFKRGMCSAHTHVYEYHRRVLAHFFKHDAQ